MRKNIILLFVVLIFILSSCVTNDVSDLDRVQSESGQSQTETIGLSIQNEESESGDIQLAIGGGDSLCTVHHEDYHTIPMELIEYIGKTRYYDWVSSESEVSEFYENTECKLGNIKTVIDEFDISKDEFAEVVGPLFRFAYNLDLLFGGTLEEIDSYYKNIEELQKFDIKELHLSNIYDSIYFNYSDEIVRLGIDERFHSRSIPEIIEKLKVERSVFEGYVEKATKEFLDQLGVVYTFDYNIDMIYGPDTIQSGTITLEPQTNILSVNHDDDPTNDISTNELNEMFCRIGRYAEGE